MFASKGGEGSRLIHNMHTVPRDIIIREYKTQRVSITDIPVASYRTVHTYNTPPARGKNKSKTQYTRYVSDHLQCIELRVLSHNTSQQHRGRFFVFFTPRASGGVGAPPSSTLC